MVGRRSVWAFSLLLAATLASSCQAAESEDRAGASAAKEGPDVAIVAIDAFIADQKIDKSASGWKTRVPRPPQVEFESGKSYYWQLDTTVGPIKIELLPDVAPMHVSSTVYLTRLGFYDGTPFHRVIDGFMAQGGDPLGRGTGGPAYKYDGEFSATARHDKAGVLSMANAGPGTDGSQFFITFGATPHLDGKHTVFGQVVEGMETVQALEQRGSRSGRPSEPLEIRAATISVE